MKDLIYCVGPLRGWRHHLELPRQESWKEKEKSYLWRECEPIVIYLAHYIILKFGKIPFGARQCHDTVPKRFLRSKYCGNNRESFQRWLSNLYHITATRPRVNYSNFSCLIPCELQNVDEAGIKHLIYWTDTISIFPKWRKIEFMN